MTTANDDLMRILGFTEEDLTLNRVGEITETQIAKLKYRVENESKEHLALALVLFTAVGYGLFNALFLEVQQNNAVMIAMLCLIGGWFLFVALSALGRPATDTKERTVMTIDAPIRVKQLKGKYGDTYWLVLGQPQLPLQEYPYKELKSLSLREGEAVAYRWYFLQRSGLVLSAERLK